MIRIENVLPTPSESRPFFNGWGAVHWICVPYTYAFLIGFLVFGLVAVSIAEDAIPPMFFVACLGVSWFVWWASALAVRTVMRRAAERAPTGRLTWDWTIGPETILFTNGLQTNELDWRAVKSVREEKDRFLFLVTPSYNPLLPKRLLDTQQLASLRELIGELRQGGRLGAGLPTPPVG